MPVLHPLDMTRNPAARSGIVKDGVGVASPTSLSESEMAEIADNLACG